MSTWREEHIFGKLLIPFQYAFAENPIKFSLVETCLWRLVDATQDKWEKQHTRSTGSVFHPLARMAWVCLIRTYPEARMEKEGGWVLILFGKCFPLQTHRDASLPLKARVVSTTPVSPGFYWMSIPLQSVRLEMWQFFSFYWFRGRGKPLPVGNIGGQGVCLSSPQLTQQWCWLTSGVCGEDKLVTLCCYQGHCNTPNQLKAAKGFFRNCSSLLHQKNHIHGKALYEISGKQVWPGFIWETTELKWT